MLRSLPRTPHGKVDLAALGAMPLRQPPTSWPDDPTERRLAELFATVLGLDSVDAEGDFFALGGDSLALLTLLARAEAAGVPLSASQVLAAPRVRDLARLRERERDPEVRSTIELTRFVPSRVADARPHARLGPRDTLVLTGATGFLGARLHRALLERGHRVVAIVRACSNEVAQHRVEGDALAGDVVLPQLGLDATTYDALAARAVGVVHLAARVSLAASYEVLAPANVDGTANALALATVARVPFLHASTLSVFVASDRSDTTFFEHDAASSPCTIAGGYAQSKWVAEQLVQRAEVPTTIVRYGLLTPDRERFVAPDGDWLVRFVRELASRLELPPALLDGELSFDATPVDHAVAATLRLIEREARGTFHVAGARGVDVRRLIDAMRAEGVTLERSPSSDPVTTSTETRAPFADDATRVLGAARAHAPDRFARHRALDLFAATGVRFDDVRARAEGIVAPEVDDAYLGGCVRAMLRS